MQPGPSWNEKAFAFLGEEGDFTPSIRCSGSGKRKRIYSWKGDGHSSEEKRHSKPEGKMSATGCV